MPYFQIVLLQAMMGIFSHLFLLLGPIFLLLYFDFEQRHLLKIGPKTKNIFHFKIIYSTLKRSFAKNLSLELKYQLRFLGILIPSTRISSFNNIYSPSFLDSS